jgi:hypothetical protein
MRTSLKTQKKKQKNSKKHTVVLFTRYKKLKMSINLKIALILSICMRQNIGDEVPRRSLSALFIIPTLA